MEIWRDIEGYEGLYMVSSYGRVKSLERIDSLGREIKEIILDGSKNPCGYLIVGLSKNGKEKAFGIHRLVGLHFIPIPERLKNIPIEKLEVGHLKKLPDGTEDKTANEVWNLAWMSKSENLNYGTRNERASKKLINHPNKSKVILQYDLDGNFIKEFPSTKEIERQIGFAHNNISKCCNGKYKQAYGYKWQFKNG